MVLPCLPCLAVAPALGSLVLPTAAASGVSAAYYIKKSRKTAPCKVSTESVDNQVDIMLISCIIS